jgi:hypothetical protein
MSLGIAETIRPLLRDRSVRFVFPSEVCAEAWLAESLRMGAGAMEADRFLGWDRLKEAAAQVEGRPAADDYLRRVFAASLLAKNAASPFLSELIPPAYAGLWQPFAGFLASKLPSLGRLPEAMRSSGARGEAVAEDWLEIRSRYESFLRDIGRFEPSYEPRSLRELPGRTLIFFPELIEDFEEYAAILEDAASVRLVRLPPPPEGIELSRPETALAELKGVLSEVGSLLDSGLAAERIAITVAGLERYRPYLEREAALLSIPLALRSGTSLEATSGGRLFAALREAYSSGFAFDSLRALLSSPAWPWKEPLLGRAIVSEGLRLHAIASWPEGGKIVDAWERSLHGRLLDSYRKLRRRISDIVAAPDFKSILRAYGAFKAEYLSQEKGDWDEGVDLSLARCVVELQGLKRAQEEAGLEVEGAFGLFMRVLESKPYVASASGAAVPVYEWRVAAGIRPERHFVLGASQDALALPYRGFDFLGPRLRERLQGARVASDASVATDAAPAFIAAYARSGASVSISCPRAGFDGEVAVHGFLAASSRQVEALPRDGSYGEEAAWLSGRGERPERLHRVQFLGLGAAALAPPAAPSSRRGGREGAYLGGEAALLARRRLYREGEARPGLDSSSIDAYRSCPYAYLYLRLLKAGPEASGIAFVDALFLGEVYHEALALLFARVREEDGRFKPERAEAYAELVGDCLGAAFSSLARNRGAFVGAVLEAYRGRLELYLRNLVAAEAARFPNLEVGPLEEDFELEYPGIEGGLVLRGRIDRVSRSERGAVIVDYKKGGLPAKAQVAPDGEGRIAEAQIPCYLRLAAAAGEELDSAWYLSVEGDARREAGSGACAFDGCRGGKSAYVPAEGLEAFLASFDAALAATARGIFAGEFPLAPKEAQKTACLDCGARGICRERYALRFGTGGEAR